MATTAAPRNLANPNPTQPATTTAPPPSSGGDELNKAAPTSKTGSGSDDVASVNAIHKKMKRAERFGVPVQLSEEEKRNSRAERFGTASGGASKPSEELKKKARAERFGIPQAASGSTNEDSKKKARLERFGVVPKMDSLEDEKKKARAIRFSESQSNSKARQSGGGAIESKTMGEAGVV